MSSVSENVDNRHNTLPEDIASNVFPLMPTIYAVQTSVLSKRWRYTWMLFPNLDFDDTHFQPVDLNSSITKLSKFETRNKESFRKFVDHVLNVCKPSNVKLFRLRVSGYVFESVTNWIDIAIWLNISEFDIQVIPRKGPKTVLPLTLFTYSTITKLKLSKTSWECPPSVYLPSMKTLDIIGSINPCDIAFKLICGCPVLESLSLEVLCSNNKEDYVFNIPSLKRLTLKIRSKVSNEVVLNLPNLEYLFVGGVLRLLFIEEDMFLLIWASFAPCERTFNHSLVDILNKIRGVQSLSIPYVSLISY
ncbi:F-box/LRR-repeat protein At3g59200-like [Bidens hawaiensis]|uniref:F-box/LRR-repeat protein At3g59200-like n=1 Tax=Bidens hawaiensis TaxID=980011 RepID=UPI004049D7F7